MYDVVALGELLIDFTTQSIDSDGYPTMAAHPGGAPANFLAAIAKFGGKVGMLGKVGTDTFGKLLTNTLRGAGIETKGLVAADDVFTTLAFVTLDENGDPDPDAPPQPPVPEVQRAKRWMQLSYTGRMLLLVGVAIVALTAPCFHPVAAALALLFPRLVIFLRGFVKPKNKEA